MQKTAWLLLLLLAALAAQPGKAQTRHDSAVFLTDVSGTVSDSSKAAESARIVKDMNERFPSYVKSAGLMVFGNNRMPQLDWLYDVAKWDQSGLDAAAAKIAAGKGSTPIGAALSASDAGLKKSEGKTALIIVSDGLNNGASDPVAKAKALKEQYGANLCIFTIQLGNAPDGAALLASLVEAGGCGKTSTASGLQSADAVQSLVDYIFPSGIEAPPAKVEDSDGDGVYDDADQCPGTPRGVEVDSRGCWVLIGIKFDTGKSDIKPIYIPLLEDVVKVMNDNSGIVIVIEGHTDAQGSDESNQKLSESRAIAVMNYLIGKGIDAGRMTAKGYGESQPIADNNTAEGMAQNRRIELKVVK